MASPVRIHSVAEAYLLLMATPCESCGKGPLEALQHQAAEAWGTPARRLFARCKACRHEQEFHFDLSDVHDLNAQGELPQFNPGQEPSRAIDLAQWLMLFEAIVRAADEQADPAESRRLGYEAAQCLEEALKFYPAGGQEWPGESAFFHDWTLERFTRHRHLFARSRLVELRRKLPTLTQMELRLGGQDAEKGPVAQRQRQGTIPSSSDLDVPEARKRRWWQFWR
jgi:hypothetical protein